MVTRRGCHLCDLALSMLESEATRRSIAIVLVDVDADAGLLRDYDLRVPVVRIAGRELCEGMIMPLALSAALDEVAPQLG